MNFEKIKYMREYYDYSQSFVAKKLHVKRGTYAQKLVMLANLFECNVDYLMGLNLTREKNKSKFDSKNENGKNYPTTYTIYEIAKKYVYSLDWITGRSHKKKLLVTE